MMRRDIGKPIYVAPDHTVAIYAKREDVPEGAKGPVPGHARFVRFTAQGSLGFESDCEVLPSGIGLWHDKERGGVMVCAPRVVEPGDVMDPDDLYYDLQQRRWVEGWEVADQHDKAPGFTMEPEREA